MKRIICWIKGHKWLYIIWEWKYEEECMMRECQRCELKEKLQYHIGYKRKGFDI